MKKVLIIAGSDSIGGAGLQADIKACTMNGVYAMTAITVLTAQNTVGVQSVLNVPGNFLKAQIDSVFEDIVPDAVKIGMVPSGDLYEIIAERLTYYKVKNIVVDPVMVCTSGFKVLNVPQINILTKKLFPISTVVTPNLFEAGILSGHEITNKEEMTKAAKKISFEYKCNVFLKGGHFQDNADDLLFYKDGNYEILESKRIDNPNTHGTGCTLSSAITSNLAKGLSLFDSVKNAKEYVHCAIASNLNLGNGCGPIDHMACRDFIV